MRILVVEDEIETAKILKRNLEAESYAVDIEGNGEKGFYLARTNDYDLIILDNMLPGREGADVCRGLREYKIDTPILMLSVQSEVGQKVSLLKCGADDYLTKPYSFTELSARVGALLRRSKDSNLKDRFTTADIVLDRATFTVSRGEKSVYLTPKEFALLEYLAKNCGRIVTRGMILEHVWDISGDPFTNAIESHIRNLRKKMDTGYAIKLIHTVAGRGYKFGTTK